MPCEETTPECKIGLKEINGNLNILNQQKKVKKSQLTFVGENINP